MSIKFFFSLALAVALGVYLGNNPKIIRSLLNSLTIILLTIIVIVILVVAVFGFNFAFNLILEKSLFLGFFSLVFFGGYSFTRNDELKDVFKKNKFLKYSGLFAIILLVIMMLGLLTAELLGYL